MGERIPLDLGYHLGSEINVVDTEFHKEFSEKLRSWGGMGGLGEC
jgi:hypothetical protein